LELFRQCGSFCFSLAFGTVPKKTTTTTLSEQFQKLKKNKNYHTVGTVPKAKEKQKLSHYQNSSKS
jgi:hypothetical protein